MYFVGISLAIFRMSATNLGQAALHVDRIIPRSKGGADSLSNFQCLCITCNTNKRDTDDTDFRGVVESYNDRSDDCLFCNDCADRVIAENEPAVVFCSTVPLKVDPIILS